MKASGYDRAIRDWYVEPPWCVHAMLDVEPIIGSVWDPFCGGGNIPKVFEARGRFCNSSDIVDRGCGDFFMDFFSVPLTEDFRYDNIVTNPPFNRIEEFVPLALSVVTRKVIILARLALLESTKRREMLETTPLARVWVSSKRISMPPGGTGIKAEGGTVAYAWFVWEHGYAGKPEIGWI